MKQKVCGIYKIINKVNGHFYIGSSTDINWRFYTHKRLLSRNEHFNIYLQRAWNKYGENNFDFSIYQEMKKSECLSEEQKLIDEHHGKDYFYNLDKCAKMTSDDVNRKRSDSLRGRKWTDEQRKNASLSQKNKKITQKIIDGRQKSAEALIKWRKEHPDEVRKITLENAIKRVGCKQSENFKRVMSEKMRGRIIPEETRLKISMAQRGIPKKPRTKEHQEKLAASQRGKKRSKETCERLRRSLLAYYKNDPEARKKNSERVKSFFENPDNRNAASEKTKSYFQNSENRKLQSERMKLYYQNRRQI